jgi:hypothetical protein
MMQLEELQFAGGRSAESQLEPITQTSNWSDVSPTADVYCRGRLGGSCCPRHSQFSTGRRVSHAEVQALDMVLTWDTGINYIHASSGSLVSAGQKPIET